MDSYEREARGTGPSESRSRRVTTTFICVNGECPNHGESYSVAAVLDGTGSYVDGETACSTCGVDGEESG